MNAAFDQQFPPSHNTPSSMSVSFDGSLLSTSTSPPKSTPSSMLSSVTQLNSEQQATVNHHEVERQKRKNVN